VTIVNVALPQIGRGLGASVSGLQGRPTHRSLSAARPISR
jgi:hypothetical protein